jgi:hypothetical protein
VNQDNQPPPSDFSWDLRDWLRVVRVIWLDQVCYWKTYRPTAGVQAGYTIFIKVSLGSTIIWASFFLILNLASLEGLHITQPWILAGSYFSIGFLLFSAMLLRKGFANGFGIWFIPIQAIGGLSGSIILSLILLVVNESTLSSMLITLIYGLIGFQAGVSVSLINGVATGQRTPFNQVLPLAAPVGLLSGFLILEVESDFILALAVAFLTMICMAVGIIIGSIWSTRQIKDDTLRQSLARPEQE